MRTIGLTGGIGTGKSTVAAMLRELGATVVDADEAARAVVEPGTPGLQMLLKEFGPEIVREGRLDRARLAEIAFADSEARRRLEAVTHPLVREWMGRRVLEAAERGDEVVVLDIPLLFESGREGEFDTVVVVAAPPDVQLERLVAKGYSEAQARARIAAQLPLEDKVRRAGYVIDNSGDLESTREHVRRAWAEISRLPG
jgi:dephospho-CoA kinase